jgi:hypothetical protein
MQGYSAEYVGLFTYFAKHDGLMEAEDMYTVMRIAQHVKRSVRVETLRLLEERICIMYMRVVFRMCVVARMNVHVLLSRVFRNFVLRLCDSD